MDITEAYEQYAAPIRGYIAKMVRNQDIAEDLTQETFIKAMRAWETLRGETVRAWLYRIAHNLIVDHARRVARVAWAPLDEATSVFSQDEFEQCAEREHIEATLSALKPKYARALRLCLDGGNIGYAVLAARAGVSEDAFKSHVSRGRRLFAVAYEQRGA